VDPNFYNTNESMLDCLEYTNQTEKIMAYLEGVWEQYQNDSLEAHDKIIKTHFAKGLVQSFLNFS